MIPYSTLSHRGNIASTAVLRPDFEIFFEATKNLYDKETNPNGTFPLNVAENVLNWTMLRDKITQVNRENDIPDWVSGYTSCLGAPDFRAAVAGFLQQFVTHSPINPDHLAMSAGATAVIEMTAFLLADAGDVAVFPVPAYPVYKQDMGNKGGVERYDLITHHDIESLQGEPILEIHHLEQALQDVENQGKQFRILVLTSPDNPTGIRYPFEKLLEITDWCIDHEIHLIVNEIYALSLIDTQHPELETDYPSGQSFASFAEIIQTEASDYLHLIYAFSKDFGFSGARMGLVYSQNEQFLQAYDNYGAPHLISNHTQWFFQLILEDEDFIARYIAQNQRLLTEAYLVVIRVLRKLQVPYVPSRGSLFIWLDLSAFLVDNTQEAETEFWLDLYHQTGVLLTPGEGFGHSKKGLFRMVYPCVPLEHLVVAMQRLERYILEKR